jgi:hypothetical protein
MCGQPRETSLAKAIEDSYRSTEELVRERNFYALYCQELERLLGQYGTPNWRESALAQSDSYDVHKPEKDNSYKRYKYLGGIAVEQPPDTQPFLTAEDRDSHGGMHIGLDNWDNVAFLHFRQCSGKDEATERMKRAATYIDETLKSCEIVAGLTYSELGGAACLLFGMRHMNIYSLAIGSYLATRARHHAYRSVARQESRPCIVDLVYLPRSEFVEIRNL